MKQQRVLSERAKARCRNLRRDSGKTLGDRLARGDRQAFDEVLEALRVTRGNVAAAARRLNVAPRTPWRWLELYPELEDCRNQTRNVPVKERYDLQDKLRELSTDDHFTVFFDPEEQKWVATLITPTSRRIVYDTYCAHALFLLFDIVTDAIRARAHRAAQQACKSGRLRPQQCAAIGRGGCRGQVQMHHHRGYDERHWLDVVWLCEAHHGQQHSVFNRVL